MRIGCSRLLARKNVLPLIVLILSLAFVLNVPAYNQPAQAQDTSDLLITGVIDGPLPGGLPKAVELYARNDIADLSGYALGSANNGEGTDGEEFTFPDDSVTAGDFIYVASKSEEFTAFFGFPPDYINSAASINGDDAIELFRDGEVVDVVGEIEYDATILPWEYNDGWIYRVSTTGPDGSTFDVTNWTFSGAEALDDETSNDTAAQPFPIGTYDPDNDGDTDIPPTVSNTTPADGAINIPVDADIEITFSEDVTVTDDWFTIDCTTSEEVSADSSGGPQSYTLDPDNDLATDETCTVTILADQVADQDDPPDNLAANVTFSFNTFSTEVCGIPDTPIGAIQGTGDSFDPAFGGTQTVQGVVIGDYEGESPGLRGFFIQNLPDESDDDPLTSDGIFVFNESEDNVNAGQIVQVTGTVDEFRDQTQISSPVIELCADNGSSITPTDITFPLTSPDDFERYESMLVNFPQALVVSEYFNYDRFGETVLALPLPGEDRPYNPTAVEMPGADAQARAEANALRRITLDDGRADQNPDPLRHPNGNDFGLDNSFRGGDTVQNATGVLDFRFDLFRIQPTAPADYTATNPRPTEVPDVGGTLTVASFNVLNYFLTLDTINDSSSNNDPADDICGPTNNRQDCRGADEVDQPDPNDFPVDFELIRQRDKLIAALAELDADIVGLIELENTQDAEGNDVNPLQDIVDTLNSEIGGDVYAYVDTDIIGTDTIRVGFIYKSATVSPVGDFTVLDSSVDPRFIDDRNRPALAQTFVETASGEAFTVAVNHFKSKGSSGLDDDPTCQNDPGTNPDCDQDDGQGFWNFTRTQAAAALADWLATDPTNSGDSDVLIIGDLNAYAMEEPITSLETAGYTNLIAEFSGPLAYSFVFSGEFGYLDYVLANASMRAQVTGVAEWSINADEPDIYDYNIDFRSVNQINNLYAPDTFRTSDHDPVVVGLDLADVGPAPSSQLFMPIIGN